MIYQVDTANFIVYEKHCICKKKLVIKLGSHAISANKRMLLINEGHVMAYSRKGNLFFIATAEGYLRVDHSEFNTFFTPCSAPDPVYINTQKTYVELDQESFNRIS